MTGELDRHRTYMAEAVAWTGMVIVIGHKATTLSFSFWEWAKCSDKWGLITVTAGSGIRNSEIGCRCIHCHTRYAIYVERPWMRYLYSHRASIENCWHLSDSS